MHETTGSFHRPDRSAVGTWMTTSAINWLVYRLTGSALLLGVVGFAGQFPAFLLGPCAGIFVDRWDRHRLLVVTQTSSMVQSFALAALTLTGHITIHAIILLSVVQGVTNAFDMPGRQAFLLTMVENKGELANAIALNSSMVNAARLVGPSIAGLIIAATNEGWCFLIDGVSYVAVLAALLRMRIARPEATPRGRRSAVQQFREGFDYAFGFRPIRSIIILLALVSLVGVPYSVLMPVFAATIFHGGPHTLGWLMTASGCGALAGALWLASRRSVLGLGRVIPAASALFGLGLIAFSFSRSLWILVFGAAAADSWCRWRPATRSANHCRRRKARRSRSSTRWRFRHFAGSTADRPAGVTKIARLRRRRAAY